MPALTQSSKAKTPPPGGGGGRRHVGYSPRIASTAAELL